MSIFYRPIYLCRPLLNDENFIANCRGRKGFYGCLPGRVFISIPGTFRSCVGSRPATPSHLSPPFLPPIPRQSTDIRPLSTRRSRSRCTPFARSWHTSVAEYRRTVANVAEYRRTITNKTIIYEMSGYIG